MNNYIQIEHEKALKHYMNSVWIATGINLLITFGTSLLSIWITSFLGDLFGLQIMQILCIIAWVSAAVYFFYAVYKFGQYQPQYTRTASGNYSLLDCYTNNKRQYYAYTLFVSQGVVITPVIKFAINEVPEAFIITAVLTLFTIIIALYIDPTSTTTWKPALYGCLSCLSLIGFLGIFIPAFHAMETYCGIVIFSLLNVYHTHETINKFNKHELDHIGSSVQYGMNFVNIFIRITEIIGNNKIEKRNKK